MAHLLIVDDDANTLASDGDHTKSSTDPLWPRKGTVSAAQFLRPAATSGSHR